LPATPEIVTAGFPQFDTVIDGDAFVPFGVYTTLMPAEPAAAPETRPVAVVETIGGATAVNVHDAVTSVVVPSLRIPVTANWRDSPSGS
jgi:hypothetical protein